MSEQWPEVSAVLAAMPIPALPDTFEARISAAIAAEAATRMEMTSAIGVSATARSISPESSAGSFTAPRRRLRSLRPRRTPAGARPPVRGRRRLLSAPAIGSLAATLVVAGFAVFFVQRNSSGPIQSAESGSAASPQYGGSGHAAAGSALPRMGSLPRSPVAARGAGSRPRFTVTKTGTSYEPDTLASQVRAVLTAGSGPSAAPASPSAGAVPTAALAGCVNRLTGNGTPRLVDRASYSGRPAYLIAVPARAWVVGLGCTATNTELITSVSLAGLSGNLRALGSVERRAIVEKGTCSDRRT